MRTTHPLRATAAATQHLANWASGLTWHDVPPGQQAALQLVLLDTLGVMTVGTREETHTRLVAAWRPQPGPSPLVGAAQRTTVEAAAWLNATALVSLELDEGHKRANGHPAGHGFPAVLALAADLDCTGQDTLAALAVAYEVAARFGRATRLRPGLHPHGSWGVAGAAAGCARLLALDPSHLAAAIDTGAGMPVAGHFRSALDGNPVRDAWMGASNLSGLTAARLAAAGIACSTGTAALSLGKILGTLEPTALDADVGRRWELGQGYLKRHAACSYTHPAADAALAIRERLSGHQIRAIGEIEVQTHALAAPLSRKTWDNRLAALFSIPFVVAAALVHGQVGPFVSTDDQLANREVKALAFRVTVVESDELTARLPDERAARVTVRVDGSQHVAESPNPIGDSAFHPMARDDVLNLLRSLLEDDDAVATITAVVDEMPTSTHIANLLRRLA